MIACGNCGFEYSDELECCPECRHYPAHDQLLVTEDDLPELEKENV